MIICREGKRFGHEEKRLRGMRWGRACTLAKKGRTYEWWGKSCSGKGKSFESAQRKVRASASVFWTGSSESSTFPASRSGAIISCVDPVPSIFSCHANGCWLLQYRVQSQIFWHSWFHQEGSRVQTTVQNRFRNKLRCWICIRLIRFEAQHHLYQPV